MLPVGTVLTAVGELDTAVEHPSEFKVGWAGEDHWGSTLSSCREPDSPVGFTAAVSAKHWDSCLRLIPPSSVLAASHRRQGAVRRGGKMLVLRQPRDGPFLLSRQPLPEVIASLQASSVACQQWATAFSALGATMLVAAAAQKAAIWLRQRRMRQRIEKALRERRAAAAAGGGGEAGATAGQQPAPVEGGQGAAEGAEDDGGIARGLCVICFDRQPDVVFPACGHMCACARCGGGLQRCPICRSRGRPIRVFTP